VIAQNDWSGLKAIWRILKRVACAFLMSLVAALVFGVTSATVTCYVYMIGLWLGVPFGLLFGAFLGWKMPARDVLVVVGAALLVFLATGPLLEGHLHGPLMSGLADLFPFGTAALAAPVSYGIARLIPTTARYWVAVACAWLVCIWLVVGTYHFLTRDG